MKSLSHSWVSLLFLAFMQPGAKGAEGAYQSHPPMRPLPAASNRPLEKGTCYFVDATKGDDQNDGSKAMPWKTVQHGVKQLKAGNTLVVRGGVYYEHVNVTSLGAIDKPITIRSHPGELAILDGGIREFFDQPTKAWEHCKDGVDGEFKSTRTYPGLHPIVMGNFGDSMIPLHGYRHLIDLRTDSQYWTLENKLDKKTGINCGPGLWYDDKTGHVHVRLLHTNVSILGDANYRGETDPRKLALVVSGDKPPLSLEGAKHVHIKDIVVRGSSRATISIAKAEDIELDGVTVYGGAPALWLQETRCLRILHSALRGPVAPWSSRGSQKYRGSSEYLFWSSRDLGLNREVEIANCELTDAHDGPYIGTIKGLKFHHNLVDNFNDDGIYLTAAEMGGDIYIYQNRISRCLTTFAFHGNYKPGSGVWIYRNVIDLRQGIPYQWPTKADDPLFQPKIPGGPPRYPSAGRLCCDHGSPIWEPINFYHNTVVSRDPVFRDEYAGGWGGHVNSKRRVFNNIFVQVEGIPGLNFSTSDDALLQVDGNLLWGAREGKAVKGDFFAAFRKSARFDATKKNYPPGWGAHDCFADPQFVHFSPENWTVPFAPQLRPGSRAIKGGLNLPPDWPDPFKGTQDMGALPLGADLPRVGVRGRFAFSGAFKPVASN